MSVPPASPSNVDALSRAALDAGQGVLRLLPTWVPRSFLEPGGRLKLSLEDLYALGAHRGGIDERWVASTTTADNPGAPPDEGLSYVVHDGRRILLRDAVAALGGDLVGKDIWDRYHRWPVLGKLFDNAGPIPHHLHQDDEMAALVGRQAKPEGYYFPPQLNTHPGRFPHTFFGLEPGTTRDAVRRCLETWERGDNGILDLSRAYRLRPGTGWLVGPRILHAPGSLVTFEPQWASDVFAMYQSVVEGRPVPWELLVKDVPEDRKRDLDFLVELIDWPANTDERFRARHYLEPLPAADSASEGFVDRWVVYGTIGGRQRFSAKELTIQPGVRVSIRDGGAYGLIVMQGRGRIGALPLECPAMIRFGQATLDEVFVSAGRAQSGVSYECTSDSEPLVMLRYFGPDAHSNMPEVGGI